MDQYRKNDVKLIVIGGGAAGFFCAVNAARSSSSLRVILVEKTGKLLSKVRVSGGGRCNVTHACFEIPELVKNYPRGHNFLKKAFHWYNTANTISWFEERGVKLKTEADGRMFPVTDSSQTIIECLIKEANKYEVEIIFNKPVDEISINNGHASSPNSSKRFCLKLSDKSFIDADFVCVACGGFPKSSQFDWLRNTGHSFENPVPSLFTFNMPGNSITALMGISVNNVTLKIQSSKLTQTGPLLITHWGISGPAVLKLSAWGARELSEMNYHFTTIINWAPQYNENSLRNTWPDFRRRYTSQQMNNKNPFELPARLWLYFLDLCSIPHVTRWSDLSTMQQNKLIKTLTSQELQVKGKTTFKEEFVTCGGIKLSEIDANTMQSKIVPGLFFGGEIMDVDGITGGFNFQHAWTSGWIAAKNIADTVRNEMITSHDKANRSGELT